MKFLKKIKTLLFCTLFIKSAIGSFTIENDTGCNSYKIYSPTHNECLENFRVRVTFHETAKDWTWVNHNYRHVNKAHIPGVSGVISNPVEIEFPELQSFYTKHITLYLTASYFRESIHDVFLSGTTYILNESQEIKNIHIRFKGLNLENYSSNVEMVINSLPTNIISVTKEKHTSYINS